MLSDNYEEAVGMKIGICLPNNWGVEDVQSIFRIAVRSEDLGFDSVWVSEHVFNVSYVFDRIGSRPYYDPMTILSYVAAITKRVRLGTSVLVLPYHNPVRLAKTAATLDVMSGGRLTLGVGVGVIEQELDAMNSPFAERGAISEEAIAIMKELWTKEDPAYEGRYHRFSDMKFTPKPVQQPHIPLLIGGVSDAAIRRAVRVGNGWHSTTMPPEELGPRLRYLKERAETVGRDISEIPVSVRLDIGTSRSARSTAAGSYSLGTDSGEILENARAFEGLGVDEMVISPTTGDGEEILAALEMLAKDVAPAFQ